MQFKRISPFIALAMFAAGVAQAQTAGVVTLQANRTSSTGSFAPVLTWSTNPVASSCTASGGWSGTKAASGSQTLSTISASTTYTLTCTWSSGSANVTWSAPTTNTDGSSLTNLASYRVVYGTSSSSLNNSVVVDDVTRTSANVSSLTPGTWYFAVRAVNTSNVQSSNSNVASKVVSGATANKSVAITITSSTTPPPTTPPPTTPPTTPPASGSELEPNDYTGQAQVISSSGSTVNGTMASSGDYDYYRVSLPSGKRLTAVMTPNSSSDYELYLYGTDGSVISWSEKGSGVAETVNVTNSRSSTATYYVRVNRYAGGTGSTNGKYTIRFSW